MFPPIAEHGDRHAVHSPFVHEALVDAEREAGGAGLGLELESPFASELVYESGGEFAGAGEFAEAFAEAEDAGAGFEAYTPAARAAFERYAAEPRAETGLEQEQETAEGLRKKLSHLALFPHLVEANGKDVALAPAVMDPGIYDGPSKYKIATTLQACLLAAMERRRDLRHIKVALVDLSRDVQKPEMAAYSHKSQVFAASVPKIAAMLAAFQLRHDLGVLLKQNKGKSRDQIFDLARAAWAQAQADPGGSAAPLARDVTLRGKLVLVRGHQVGLSDPRVPRLGGIFAPLGGGGRLEFTSTGEDKDQLHALINGFNRGAKGAREKLDALGFLERLRLLGGGLVPASNYATATIVRDVGFPFIASTLIQSGLYNTDRNGGLWLGADYWGTTWRGPLGGGAAQSATAGSLAAFMTLLMQDRLVSPQASAEMRALIKKEPNPTHPGIVSWFRHGLKRLRDGGLVRSSLSKLGAHSGVDDCAFIDRKVEIGSSVRLLRYVAVGLRAENARQLQDLILELDKCILANNSLSLDQGGHSP